MGMQIILTNDNHTLLIKFVKVFALKIRNAQSSQMDGKAVMVINIEPYLCSFSCLLRDQWIWLTNKKGNGISNSKNMYLIC